MFRKRFFMPNPMMQVSKSENQRFSSSGALKSQNMQISLKLIRGLNHVKLTIHTKFQSLVIFNSPVTGSSILPVFALSVLYMLKESPEITYFQFHTNRVKEQLSAMKFAKIVFYASILKQIYAADIMLQLQQHCLPGTVLLLIFLSEHHVIRM